MAWQDRARRLREALRDLRGRPLARSGAGLGGITIIELALGLLTAVLLARELGATGLGVYSLALAVIVLAGLPVEFGMPALITREIAHAGAGAAEDVVKGVLAFAVTVIATMSVAVVALLLMIAPSFARPLGEETAAILPLAALLIPVNALTRAGSAALAGRQKVVLSAVPLRLVRPALLALAIGGAALVAPGWLTPRTAIAVQLGTAVLALMLSLGLFLRHLGGALRRRRAMVAWRDWFAAMLRLGLSDGMMLAQPQVLLLLTGILSTEHDVGLLRVAQRGVGLIGAGTAIAVTVAAPRVAALYAEGRHARVQRLVTLVARATWAISLAGLMLYLLAGEWLLALMFGPDFLGAWGALMVLSAGVLVRVTFGPGVMLMNMLRRESRTVVGLLLSLTLSVLSALLLVPVWGVLGAGWAGTIGGVSMAVFLWHQARRELDLDPGVGFRLMRR